MPIKDESLDALERVEKGLKELSAKLDDLKADMKEAKGSIKALRAHKTRRGE